MEDGGTNWEISELQFRAVAGTIQAPSGGSWLSTSGSPSGNVLGDLNFGSYFQTTKTQSVGYDFGSPVTVVEVAIAPYCTYVLDSPSSFNVQYSDDGTTWTTLSSVTSASYSCSTYELAELPGTSVIYNFYYDTSAIPYTLWGYLGGTYYPITPYPSYAPLTDSSSVTWAVNGARAASSTLTLAHGTSTRAVSVTGLVPGGGYASYDIVLKQDATGGAAATLGTGCTWYQFAVSHTAPTTTLALTTTANAVDILSFSYDGTNCYAVLQ